MFSHRHLTCKNFLHVTHFRGKTDGEIETEEGAERKERLAERTFSRRGQKKGPVSSWRVAPDPVSGAVFDKVLFLLFLKQYILLLNLKLFLGLGFFGLVFLIKRLVQFVFREVY